MANNFKPVLYSYYRSSCSWRVRIALNWKKIDYEYREVNLLKGGHLSEDFARLNPLCQVPVYIENGNVFIQSIPILEYLEEAHPRFPLLPSDAVQRSKIRSIVELIASGIQPLQNVGVLKQVGEKKLEWAKYWIENGFRALEKQLKPLHGKCCVGDTVTLADVVLVPQIYNARRYEVDMTQFPLILSINDHLETYDAFKLAHASLQPDCPKE